MRRVYSILIITILYIVLDFKYMESETLQITTYYPAPYGAYVSILTTGNTILARDGGRVGIRTANPNAELDVVGNIKWGTGRGMLSMDQGASIELGGAGTPYIDFSNDDSTDFDMRLRLTDDDELRIEGGRLYVDGDLFVAGRILGFCTVVNYPGGTCPSGTQVVGFRPGSNAVYYDFYATDASTLNISRYRFSIFSSGQYICCRI